MNVSTDNSVKKTVALKDRNRWPLLFALVGNIAIFYVVSKTNKLTLDGVPELIEGWRTWIPAGFTFLFTSVSNELLSSDVKARLVFWHWKNPLPGSRAFTRYAKCDPRVDLRRLKDRFGPLPTNPNDQNTLWFRLYKSVEHHDAVTQAHRNYLFTRDYATAALFLWVTLGVAGLWTIASLRISLLYFGLLALQYLVVRIAAENRGIRFVTNVLAIKASE
jgi:hypothetical protein